MLIAFSGVDGAGKSTQIQMLTDRFEKEGIDCKVIWSRGGYTPLFVKMKNLLGVSRSTNENVAKQSSIRTRSLERNWVRRLWLTLAIVDLFLLYSIYFRWLMLRGKYVIADRYILDTAIDFKINFPAEKAENWWLWKLMNFFSPKPNRYFLLLIPVEESRRRSIQKNEPFPDSVDTLEKRLEVYQHMCKKSQLVTCLDGRGPVDEISQIIISYII
ncbi:MAG: hypothetical protein OEQ53_02545 [Saprospiraceae bacterium]|nr:hypothetical protein [Saprospiraceae bacterium]